MILVNCIDLLAISLQTAVLIHFFMNNTIFKAISKALSFSEFCLGLQICVQKREGKEK